MVTPLKGYVDAAVGELGIGPDSNVKQWFIDRYQSVGRRLDPTAAQSEDVLERMYKGNYRQLSERHLAIFHEVLGLRSYDIPIEGTWKIVGEDDDKRIVMSSDEFADLLREKRRTHGDPMRWFEKTSDIMLSLHAEAISPKSDRQANPGPDRPMLNNDMEESVEPRLPVAQFKVPEGSSARISVNPMATGHVLVLNNREGSDEYASFHPWLSGSQQRERGVLVSSSPIPVSNGTGVRNLIAVNWPATLPLADYGLEDLFLRPDKKPQKYRATVDELRTIGAMAYETRDAPFHERVHVDQRTLEVVEPTSPGNDEVLAEVN